MVSAHKTPSLCSAYMGTEKLAIGFGDRRQFGRRRWVVSGLRAWYVDAPGLGRLFDRRLAFPVVLAESADEAHAIAVERVPVDFRFWPPEEGSRSADIPDIHAAPVRVFPWPEYVPIAAFDYLDAHRLIVVQDAAAWVRHYGCPLLMRTRVPVMMKCDPTVPDGGGTKISLWNQAQPHGSYEACSYASNLSEEERRESVLAWIADSGFEAGEIEASARYCAAEFLPASRAGRAEGGRRG